MNIINNIESIGLLAGFLGAFAWFPQIYKIWFLNRADGISLPTFIIISIALTLWLIYGILIKSFSILRL